jgi:hypothetical protein
VNTKFADSGRLPPSHNATASFNLEARGTARLRRMKLAPADARRERSTMRSKTIENPLLSPDARPWYPHKAVSAGCAEWAWKSCVAFADEWWKRMGLTREYQDFGA